MKKFKMKKLDLAYDFLDILRAALVALVVFLCIFTFFIKTDHVIGNSMYPTLKDGNYGLSNMFSIFFHDVDRFDIVIVNAKGIDELWVKRVIGLPNETISFKDDTLYIDGKKVEEPFLDQEYIRSLNLNSNFTNNFDEVTLGDNEYFLMGDNRISSKDSRFVGPFTYDSIVSKGLLVLHPFEDFKLVK
ncbi:MAG: signal peptidase I [Erysipelotrichaceae bacterium]